MLKITGNTIKIMAGDTAIINFVCSNHTLVSGDIVYFSVKKYLSDNIYKLQKVITSFNDGVASIELLSSDTNLPPDEYKYDIQCSLADGRVDTVIGPAVFIVDRGVTNE